MEFSAVAAGDLRCRCSGRSRGYTGNVLVECPVARMGLQRLRMPHPARQFKNVTAVDMQADRRRVAQTLRNMRGLRPHRQDRSPRQRDFARAAQLTIVSAVQRVLFRAGEQQDRCPGAVPCRGRAAECAGRWGSGL